MNTRLETHDGPEDARQKAIWAAGRNGALAGLLLPAGTSPEGAQPTIAAMPFAPGTLEAREYGWGVRSGLKRRVALGVGAPGFHWFEWTWAEDPEPGRAYAWNVSLAVEISRLGVPVERVDLGALYPAAQGVELDEARLAGMVDADLLRPAVLLNLPPEITHPGGERVAVLIDGRHRLELARRRGYLSVLVVFLSDLQAAACALTEAEGAALRAGPEYLPPVAS